MNPEAALKKIPGWEHARVTAHLAGHSRTSFLVETEAGKAVLKIDAVPRTAPFNSRIREAEIQTRAAAEGLANRVLYASEKLFLTEFVDGEVLTAKTLAARSKLLSIAQTLRRVHALPLTGRDFDARGAARTYAESISSAAGKACALALSAVDAMPITRKGRCCHNDLVAENILASPAIRLLDWEYACDNDPAFDLATIVAHHELPEQQALVFYDAYYGGRSAYCREMLAAYERGYAGLTWLWTAANAGTT